MPHPPSDSADGPLDVSVQRGADDAGRAPQKLIRGSVADRTVYLFCENVTLRNIQERVAADKAMIAAQRKMSMKAQSKACC